MTDYRFERLGRPHFAELGPLMIDAFGGSVPEDYFDWKYLQNPAGDAAGRVARAPDGSIAAFYGMIPERYRMGGAVRTIYQSCDTMTHSSHRRRGLFQRLALDTYEAAIAADPNFFAFGFSGDASTPGFLKMNWRIDALLAHRFQPFPLTLLGARDSGITEAAIASHRLLETIVDLAPAGDGLVRDRAFIEWRLANPMRDYRALLDPGRAYGIYYQEGAMIFLVDLGEREPGDARLLLRQLAGLSRASRGKGILTWGSDSSPLIKAVRHAGYLRNPWRRGPASHRIPLISFRSPPGSTNLGDLPITPLDHDSL